MTKFKINPELLIGGSSKIDAVFLPVNIDGDHSNDPEMGVSRSGDNICHNQNYHNDFELKQSLLGPDDLSREGEPEKESKWEEIGPRSVLMHAIITNTPDSDERCYRASLTSVVVIIVIVLFLVFGHSYIYSILLWLEHANPLVSVSVQMALFVIISFPVAWGLQLLMLMAGYLYGLLYGLLVVTICVSVGLLISIPIMRILCLSYLQTHFYSRKVEAIVTVVSGPHGMKVIALTRLTPIPFGLQNALFSMSSISIFRLLIASIGGLVPMTVLNCYMGSTLRNMQDLMSGDSNRLTGFFIFGGQIFITVILSWFVIRRARVELKKTMDESDKLSSPLTNGDCSRSKCADEL